MDRLIVGRAQAGRPHGVPLPCHVGAHCLCARQGYDLGGGPIPQIG